MKLIKTILPLFCALLIVGCDNRVDVKNSEDPVKFNPNQVSDKILSDYDQKMAAMSWELISRNSETANSPQEFLELQKKYPRYLIQPPNGKEVTSAVIAFSNYTYRGASVCSAKDPRRNHTIIYTQMCGGTDSAC